jgi:hypothetical protein
MIEMILDSTNSIAVRIPSCASVAPASCHNPVYARRRTDAVLSRAALHWAVMGVAGAHTTRRSAPAASNPRVRMNRPDTTAVAGFVAVVLMLAAWR